MSESLKCLYLSFSEVDLETREQVSLSNFEIMELLQALEAKEVGKELLILSTCNRTEIYYVASIDLFDILVEELCRYKRLRDVDFWKQKFLHISDADVVIHRLFRISNGLYSQVLGDFQVIRQVKDAYELAVQSGSIGSYLHRLLQSVFACHKDISTYTHIHSGNASVSAAATEMATQLLRDDKNKSVLVVGAGNFSIEIIEQLQKKGYANITIINHNDNKAGTLAEKYGIHYQPYSILDGPLDFDVVITCVFSKEPIIRTDHFLERPKPTLLIDLSVPRAVESQVAALPLVKLTNMDQIVDLNKKALEERQEAIPKAEMIIDTYYEDFIGWEKANVARPVLNQLKQAIEEIRLSEVNRYLKKWKNDPVDTEMIDKLTKNIVNKIIRVPAVRLNETSQINGSELYRLSRALAKLFDLQEVGEITST